MFFFSALLLFVSVLFLCIFFSFSFSFLQSLRRNSAGGRRRGRGDDAHGDPGQARASRGARHHSLHQQGEKKLPGCREEGKGKGWGTREMSGGGVSPCRGKRVEEASCHFGLAWCWRQPTHLAAPLHQTFVLVLSVSACWLGFCFTYSALLSLLLSTLAHLAKMAFTSYVCVYVFIYLCI